MEPLGFLMIFLCEWESWHHSDFLRPEDSPRVNQSPRALRSSGWGDSIVEPCFNSTIIRFVKGSWREGICSQRFCSLRILEIQKAVLWERSRRGSEGAFGFYGSLYEEDQQVAASRYLLMVSERMDWQSRVLPLAREAA